MSAATFLELCEMIMASRLLGLPELDIELALVCGGMSRGDIWELMRMTRG